MRSHSPPAARRVDPRDSDSFPWLRVIVASGDLTEDIDPEAWDHVPVDRFNYERLPDLSAFAMQVRPCVGGNQRGFGPPGQTKRTPLQSASWFRM